MSAPFSSLVKDYLTERYEESPTWASMLGLTAYDERSEDLSALAFRRRDAAVLEWTKRFVQVDAGVRPGGVASCEIRQIFELEDFPVNPKEKPGSWRDQERNFRDELSR